MTMARSKNCLKCHYCKSLTGCFKSKDWLNDWFCDYLVMEYKDGDKGSDPDNCKLFKAKNGKRISHLY